MRKLTNIFIIFIILLLASAVMVPNTVHAEGFWDLFFGQGAGSWFFEEDTNMDIDFSLGENSDVIGKDSTTYKIIGRITYILQVVGSIASLIAMVVIGLRYMLSSLEEKAEMKGVLIYYLIGAVLVFSVSNIIGIAYKVISGIGN